MKKEDAMVIAIPCCLAGGIVLLTLVNQVAGACVLGFGIYLLRKFLTGGKGEKYQAPLSSDENYRNYQNR